MIVYSPKMPRRGFHYCFGITTPEKENPPTQGQHRPHGGEHHRLLRTVSKVYFQLQTEKSKAQQRLFGLRFSTAEEAKQYLCDTSDAAV